MARGTGVIRSLALVAALACVVTLTDCEKDAGRDSNCIQVSGFWHVSFEGGWTDHWINQEWTIDQHDCDVSIAAYPPDDAGPLGGSSPAIGSVSEGGDIFAQWNKPTVGGACVNSSRLLATVTGNTLSGTLHWVAGGGYGGSCWPSGNVTLEVTGGR